MGFVLEVRMTVHKQLAIIIGALLVVATQAENPVSLNATINSTWAIHCQVKNGASYAWSVNRTPIDPAAPPGGIEVIPTVGGSNLFVSSNEGCGNTMTVMCTATLDNHTVIFSDNLTLGDNPNPDDMLEIVTTPMPELGTSEKSEHVEDLQTTTLTGNDTGTQTDFEGCSVLRTIVVILAGIIAILVIVPRISLMVFVKRLLKTPKDRQLPCFPDPEPNDSNDPPIDANNDKQAEVPEMYKDLVATLKHAVTCLKKLGVGHFNNNTAQYYVDTTLLENSIRLTTEELGLLATLCRIEIESLEEQIRTGVCIPLSQPSEAVNTQSNANVETLEAQPKLKAPPSSLTGYTQYSLSTSHNYRVNISHNEQEPIHSPDQATSINDRIQKEKIVVYQDTPHDQSHETSM